MTTKASPVAFNPAVHLCYEKPASVFTMKDLALEDEGISPIGVTAPFPLFTREGVTELRREILSPEVLDKYTVSSYLSAFQGTLSDDDSYRAPLRSIAQAASSRRKSLNLYTRLGPRPRSFAPCPMPPESSWFPSWSWN